MRISSLLALYAVTLICMYTGSVYSDGSNAGGGYGTYDYIVVGSGGTGNVVATRLAQAGKRVLVLEGGGPSQSAVGGTDFVAASYSFNSNGEAVYNRPLTRYDVPAFTYSAASDYPGSPTPSYPLDSNLGPYKTFSKIQGGNSVHNYMVWIRITPKSLNAWNITGWSYNDLLPYFKKVENVTGTSIAFNTAYHGYNGLVKVNNAQVPDPIGDAYIQACGNAGFPRTNDFNAPVNYQGCGKPVFNINNRGIRASSLISYLAPNLKLSNLQVVRGALVTKVLFSNTTGVPRAVGVQYEDADDGDVHTVYAGKEVILSAGAVNSVKILQLSGVGPAALLTSLGIPVIADLPVGKNMSTHPLIFTYYKYNTSKVNPYQSSQHSVEYAINGTGVFASIGVPAVAQLKSNPTLDDHDLHVQVLTATDPGLVSVLALRLKFQRDLQIRIKSSDPDVAPYLTFNAFNRDEDVQAFVNFIKQTRQIVRTAPASSFFGEEVTPGPQYQTDAQLAAYVRGGGGLPILTHLHGGNPMGNPGDPKSVVDNRVRVRKVQGLRVADLSIATSDINCLPIHNLMAFGEKIADMILADCV